MGLDVPRRARTASTGGEILQGHGQGEALEEEKEMLEQRISDLIALTAALKDCEDWEEYLDEVVQATEQLKTYLKTVKRPAMPQGRPLLLPWPGMEPASTRASTAAAEPQEELSGSAVKGDPLLLPGASERDCTASVEPKGEKLPGISVEDKPTVTLPGRDTFIRNQSIRRRSVSQHRSANWIPAV
ncbi:g899 [Coccomyxa viridis]|uniref:G899 protein n=1 Tax=Coccomyxa viridis TaxID=1274662 RepID=A0ABP1FGT1_9CHLO